VGYGLPSTEAQEGAYKAEKIYAGMVYPLVPQAVRAYLHKHGMKDMRKAVRRI